jgi:putative SOS response-associated peptidase YedK
VCGRINLWMSSAELAEVFELFREPEWLPRYNLGPMQQILSVRMHPKLVRLAEPVQWGLVPSWTKSVSSSPVLNNARCETVATKPSFSDSFRKRRCLIPANGFYEWKRLDNKTKQPWNIFRADGQPLAMAGIWDHWQTPDGDTLESCAVITTEANEFMSQIHDRMPVILGQEDWNFWLNPEETNPDTLTKLLVPCPNEWLEGTPVSSLVNQVNHDSPECIRAVKESRTLF